MSLRFGDDRFELDAGPCGDVDRDLTRIAWFVRLDGRQPLRESVGLLLSARGRGQQHNGRDEAREFQPFALCPLPCQRSLRGLQYAHVPLVVDGAGADPVSCGAGAIPPYAGGTDPIRRRMTP